MDRRQIRLEGGPLAGRVIDPTDKDQVRIIIPGRPAHLADRPVAVYVNSPDMGDPTRVFVFKEWDRRRRRGKRTKLPAVA